MSKASCPLHPLRGLALGSQTSHSPSGSAANGASSSSTAADPRAVMRMGAGLLCAIGGVVVAVIDSIRRPPVVSTLYSYLIDPISLVAYPKSCTEWHQHFCFYRLAAICHDVFRDGINLKQQEFNDVYWIRLCLKRKSNTVPLFIDNPHKSVENHSQDTSFRSLKNGAERRVADTDVERAHASLELRAMAWTRQSVEYQAPGPPVRAKESRE